jgi:protein tyrosine phosphatase
MDADAKAIKDYVDANWVGVNPENQFLNTDASAATLS